MLLSGLMHQNPNERHWFYMSYLISGKVNRPELLCQFLI